MRPLVQSEVENAAEAGTGEYGEMLEEGILDPAKVTRLALHNTASAAEPGRHGRN